MSEPTNSAWPGCHSLGLVEVESTQRRWQCLHPVIISSGHLREMKILATHENVAARARFGLRCVKGAGW
jgi:hypothetical protein